MSARSSTRPYPGMTALALLACSLAGLPDAARAQAAQKWTCTAPALKNSGYEGGSTAYIHLEGFKRGGRYAVSRKGNVATGTTANGTAFTCRAS